MPPPDLGPISPMSLSMSWSAQSLWPTVSRLSYPPLFANWWCSTIQSLAHVASACLTWVSPSLVGPLAQAAVLTSPGLQCTRC